MGTYEGLLWLCECRWGGDTSTLHVITELVWTFCTEKRWEHKTSYNCPCALAASCPALKCERVRGHKDARARRWEGTRVKGCKGKRVQGHEGARARRHKGARARGHKEWKTLSNCMGLVPWLPWAQGLAPWQPWVQGLVPWTLVFCLNLTFWPFCTERWWGTKNCVKLHGREASRATSWNFFTAWFYPLFTEMFRRKIISKW